MTPQPYPGSESAPAYRWAFAAWMILFLGIICLSLLNYFGTIWHARAS